MKYKYIIYIVTNNNKVRESVWIGEKFEKDELGDFKQLALNMYYEFVKCAVNCKVQLVKAETDNWYWNTKKVVIEQEINY